MKKLICFLMMIIFIVMVYSCNNDQSNSDDAMSSEIAESHVTSELISDLPAYSNDSSDVGDFEEYKEMIEELEEELDRIEALLTTAKDEKGELQAELEKLQNQIDEIRNSTVNSIKRIIYMNNGSSLVLSRNENSRNVLTLVSHDKSAVEIINLYYINYILPSSDSKKVIFNNFEMEVNAQVYLFDVEKQETRQLLMPDLPENYTPSFMRWLDNRYFLFVVQFDHGTVTRGGDVYLYDIENDEYKLLIGTDNPFIDICSFEIYDGDFMFFSSVIYDDVWNLTDNLYHVVKINNIYDLINNDKVMLLDEQNALNFNK